MRAGYVCILSFAIAGTLLAPRPARADGLIMPFVGADFGGNAGNCSGVTPCESRQLSYGVGIGFMVGGVVGFEGEIAHAPRFFGEGGARADNYLLSVMANLLVGVPIGPVRPYGVFGIGVLHTDVNRSDIGLYDAYTNNSVALQAGGGLMVLFARHVGVRGDLRYARTLQNLTLPQFDLADKSLEFWRGAFGVVFRF
jgi:opacity protein-like surface antigen